MSKLCDGNVVAAAAMQSWRTPRNAPENDQWPTSLWFRKYHANCKTEQWRSREYKKESFDYSLRPNKQLEQASSCNVWEAIRKTEASVNGLHLNSMMAIRQRIMKSQDNGIRTNRISSPYDVMHRIHELNCPSIERDERNWRLRIEKAKVVEKNCAS